jgi:osmotically-inducible protein OsmY
MEMMKGTLAALLMAIGLLQGCAAPLLVAGTAAGVAGAAVIAERRAPEIVLEDQGIEMRIMRAINDDRALADGVKVAATSYNRVVLLTGQVADEAARQRVLTHVRDTAGVTQIHDHLAIGPTALLAQRTRDTRTTARVKSELLGESGIPGVHVKVVTEKDVVYLMGRVSREEAQRAAALAQRVDGVKQIVLVFEYLS